jgi:hypothetical protein
MAIANQDTQLLTVAGREIKYPGFLGEPPEKLVKAHPNGYPIVGEAYALQLDSAAKAMGRGRPSLSRWHSDQGGWSWEWDKLGYKDRWFPRELSPDGLASVAWYFADVPVMRLREDGLLTISRQGCSLLSGTSYLLGHLMEQVGTLAWGTFTPIRGMAVVDQTMGQSGSSSLSLQKLKVLARAFCGEKTGGCRIRGGNNLYDFTNLQVANHPVFPGRASLFFTLVKPVILSTELLGAFWPGAIVAEIRDDGTLVLNSGMTSPIEKLGTMGRDSGADHLSPTYSYSPLFQLWKTVCILLSK